MLAHLALYKLLICTLWCARSQSLMHVTDCTLQTPSSKEGASAQANVPTSAHVVTRNAEKSPVAAAKPDATPPTVAKAGRR